VNKEGDAGMQRWELKKSQHRWGTAIPALKRAESNQDGLKSA